ncbi:MAG: mevalonate kinase [Anaerolineales bacterium]|nr:mevalonate kinase [Anaerolineales bacterium]
MKASAPGKIILFGEHAVVYNRPALAVPVDQAQVEVEVTDSDKSGVWIDAPMVELHGELSTLPDDHPIAAVILKLFQHLGISQHPNILLTIRSTIPVAAGLGSGAAVSVAMFRALSSYLSHPLSDEQVNGLVFEIEKLHHGTPSGIDNTVITYNMPVFYMKHKPVETFMCGKPFTIVIGDTGVPAPTKESVGDVRRLWLHNENRFEEMFNEIAQISTMARRFIETGHPEHLGELMDQNQEFLKQMTVSSPELDVLIYAARRAGALGAKLSGGGRGGNMIALVDQAAAESVAASLTSAGAKRTIITEIK